MQCLKEALQSFNIPTEDFNKIALDRKKKMAQSMVPKTFQVSWENRRLQASAKRHAHRIR